jgi:hypothetical protein
MTDYNVTLNSPSYNVSQSEQDLYSIGLNYETPTKGIQYQNLIIDDISSQFNCNRKTFNITVAGSPYFPYNDQQLIISIANIILQPGVGYSISGSTITFAVAPCNAHFFAIAMANTADLTRTINYVVDNGSSPMTIGDKGSLSIEVSGVIQSWVIVADKISNLLIDIKKCSYADYPDLISICGSSRPSLSNQNKNTDNLLSGWNTILNAGDILNYEVINTSTIIKKFSIALKIKL